MKFTNEERAAILAASAGKLAPWETPIGLIRDGERLALTDTGHKVAALIRENEEQAARIVELEQELDAAKAIHSDLAENVVRPAQARSAELEESLGALVIESAFSSGVLESTSTAAAKRLLEAAKAAEKALKGDS